MRVLTIGTFDLLHFGHIAFLRECKKLAGGDPVTVGVNTDRFAATFKPAPILTEDERMFAVDQAGYDTALNDGPGLDLIGETRQGAPMILAIGSDWAPPRDYLTQIGATQAQLDQWRITLAYIPYQLTPYPVSSSSIRARILKAAG